MDEKRQEIATNMVTLLYTWDTVNRAMLIISTFACVFF